MDGSHFGRVVGAPEPAALLHHEGRGTPWHTALTTDRIVGEADLTGLPEELAAAAGADGYRSCWAIPVTIRPDIAPTAALVAWRRIEGRAAPHLTTTALRVSRLVALSLEGERTRATWQRAARTDPLTGLSNRAELDEWLAWVTTLASDRPVAALFCDLDDFKPINDRYGHAAGDEVLGAVAARIRGTVRPSDVVVRWGGDEFVVLCAEPTSADDASGIARRVIEEVNHPIAVGEAQVRLGVSVGVATALAGMSHQLVGQADRALQQAKAAGKNQWRLLDATPHEPLAAEARAGRFQDRLELGHPRVPGPVAVQVHLPLERGDPAAGLLDPRLDGAERVAVGGRRAVDHRRRGTVDGRQVDRGETVVGDRQPARDRQRGRQPDRPLLVPAVLVEEEGHAPELHAVAIEGGVEAGPHAFAGGGDLVQLGEVLADHDDVLGIELLDDDIEAGHGWFLLELRESELDARELCGLGGDEGTTFGLAEPEDPPQLLDGDAVVDQVDDLRQRDTEVAQDEDPVQPEQLLGQVAPVARDGIDVGRAQKPDVVVVPQRAHGHLRQPGDRADAVHEVESTS